MVSSKRSIKLIQPRFQLKLIGTFVGLSGLALLLQFLLFTSSLSEVAADLPQDGSRLMAEIPSLVWRVFFVSFGLFLPLSVLIGITITFRWAGPLYRFKVHLGRIAAGESPGECKIRRKDELHDLCRVLNAAVADLERRAETQSKSDSKTQAA